jgi:hypothetical protein
MLHSRRNLWLTGILVLEALLFVWKSDHFFNGDSLFFFSHRIENPSDIWHIFKGPDHLWQYRPLTYIIFSFLLNPVFGMHPLGYNLFPLIVHGANTLIVFGILRMLGLADRGAVLGAFFFGVHCVAFYVTYGVEFLPDFSYALFYLLSVFLFLKFLNNGRRLAAVFSILSFILSLLCKEAAVTLPAVLFAMAFLRGENGFSMPQGSIRRAIGLSFKKTFVFLLTGAAYLAFHWMAKAGQIYAAGIHHPHHFEFSFDSLRLKYKYLKWAFNLPDGLVFRFEGLTNYLIALAILAFVVPFTLSAVRRLWMTDRWTWFGSVWFMAALSPVLFLRNLTMHHYLYVPLVGLALLVGAWLDRVSRHFADAGKGSARWIIPAFVATCTAAVLFHNWHAAKNSWIAEASVIAEASLKEMKKLHPVLPEGTTLYIIDKSPSPRGDVPWFYDHGGLFRLFYPVQSLDVRFIGPGGRLPTRNAMTGNAIILEFDGFRLRESHCGF